jgi:bifunctional non-homologous end joining protein LigD
MVEITNGKGKAATPFMTASGAQAGAVWQSDRDDSAPAGLIKPVKVKSAAKAKTAKTLPDFIEPQLTKPVGKPPAGPGWAHEIKFDGYRMQLRTARRQGALRTRKGLDWSAKFPEITQAGRGAGTTGSSMAKSAPWTQRRAGFRGPAGGDLRGQKTADLVFFVFDQLCSMAWRICATCRCRSARTAGARVDGAGRPCAMSITSSPRATRCCCRPAGWIWRASSPSAWTRPIARDAARPGPSPSVGPAMRW